MADLAEGVPREATSTPRSLRVAMALYGDLTFDSRVIREAESLAAAGHKVTIACLDASPAIVARLRTTVRVLVRRAPDSRQPAGAPSPFLSSRSSSPGTIFERAAWLIRFERSLGGWGRLITEAAGSVDVWHAHDLTGLQAIAGSLHRDVAIVYDSHELFVESGSASRLPQVVRRLLRVREAQLVARCVATITVNPGLAAELERLYRPARLVVVRNCLPRWSPLAGRPDIIRERLGLQVDASIALFHGALEPNRGIEQLISALNAPGLEKLHLVLLGYGQMREALELQTDDPDLSGRLHVLPAVEPFDLPQWVASADVGAVLQQPANRNLVLSTPNKLFEAIAVGTPVVASDLPEIARIVRDDPDGPLGVLCDPGDLDSVVAALRSVLDPPQSRLLEMRASCLRAAGSRLNWEVESANLVGLYAELNASLPREGSRAD